MALLSFTQMGSLAIFGPKSPASAAHASSICDAKEIPYIDTYMDLDSETKSSNINFYPSLDMLSQLLIAVVNDSNWQDFVILYEAPNYIKSIGPLLEQRANRGIITIQPLEVGTNFRKTLRRIKELGSRSQNIIIQCSIEHLREILEQVIILIYQDCLSSFHKFCFSFRFRRLFKLDYLHLIENS